MKQLEGRLRKEENDLLDAGTKKIQLQVQCSSYCCPIKKAGRLVFLHVLARTSIK